MQGFWLLRWKIPVSSECHIVASFQYRGFLGDLVFEQEHSVVVQHIQRQSYIHPCQQLKQSRCILNFLSLVIQFLPIGLVPYLCTQHVCNHMMVRSSHQLIGICTLQSCTETSYRRNSKAPQLFSPSLHYFHSKFLFRGYPFLSCHYCHQIEEAEQGPANQKMQQFKKVAT